MSIRIVPKEQLSKERLNDRAVGFIPPLLFANPKTLYQQRAERLKTLATASNPFSSYLNFAAEIAQAQQKALYDNPLDMELDELLLRSQQENRVPLDCKTLRRTPHWQHILHALIAELLPVVPEHVKPALENLAKNSAPELEEMADGLLNSEFSKVSADQSVFVWAALSVYWAQMASLIPGKARAEYGEHRQFCPVCGSMPVASVVQIGTNQGLRYLHCNLCDSEWHVVRIKCSNCEQTGDLNYWSLESEQAPIKAESCGDCGSYLKILYQEKDPNIDAVADDLASLILDAKMEEDGFARSSLNPFLLPNE
ncbi:formate dehydrogenase accessory protein FdhE [Xenorhabdus sp. 18]|uniref:formate dehydrogenase accessory protein FdhE n=1 Tax=Xenorhabdus doucetiae TaxID=351671 RepID=UPI00198D3953|nr:formate dehydrogenase accessory protein FdhE [Xenorhabdus sp. 18]MBD2795727.1 formate dehydrogenase accessory protein FdhE [Xenorhabdus sp. 18]